MLLGANCTEYALNFCSKFLNQEDDSDSGILDTKAFGDMASINLSGKNNSFGTVIEYLNDVESTTERWSRWSSGWNAERDLFFSPIQRKSIHDYWLQRLVGRVFRWSFLTTPLVDTLNNIFNSILGPFLPFVAPSVPVNVFNRAQIVDEVFGVIRRTKMACHFGMSKLRIGSDVNGNVNSKTWTSAAPLILTGEPEDVAAHGRIRNIASRDDEVEGKGEHAVAWWSRSTNPGCISGSPGLTNAATGATAFAEDPTDLQTV